MTSTWADVGPEGRITGPLSVQYNDPWPVVNGYPSGFVSPARGVVIHTESGYEQGTVSWFNNPASEVSSTFAVGLDGSAWQFGPAGHGWVAWHCAEGNPFWYGCEDADNTHPSVPFTAAQIRTLALLCEALSWHDGFPLQAATDPLSGEHGVTLHSEGGVPFGDHPDCPGPVRGAQRPAILEAARLIRSEREDAMTITSWKSDGTLSLAALAERRKVGASTVLRVTAGRGLFDAPLAQYIDQVFSGAITPAAPVPAGAVLWVPVA